MVTPTGEMRLKDGSYVTEATRLQLDFTPDPGDDQFILKEEGLKVEPGREPRAESRESGAEKGRRGSGREADSPKPAEAKKPKGFL